MEAMELSRVMRFFDAVLGHELGDLADLSVQRASRKFCLISVMCVFAFLLAFPTLLSETCCSSSLPTPSSALPLLFSLH